MNLNINTKVTVAEPKQMTVLVADDNAGIRNKCDESLSQTGVKVLLAASGDEVLRVLQERSDLNQPVDAIVLDIVFEHDSSGHAMDGIDIAGQIRSQFAPQNIPILFLTANDVQENRQKAADKGVGEAEWIDKGPKWYRNLTAAVWRLLRLRSYSGFFNELEAWAAEQNVPSEKIDVLLDLLNTKVLAAAIPQLPYGNPAAPREDRAPQVLSCDFQSCVSFGQLLLGDVQHGLADPAHRGVAWQKFRQLLKDELPKAIRDSALAESEVRMMLVDMMECAAERIGSSANVAKSHVKAFCSCLGRLLSEQVTDEDIRQCEREWKKAGVSTYGRIDTISNDWRSRRSEQ